MSGKQIASSQSIPTSRFVSYSMSEVHALTKEPDPPDSVNMNIHAHYSETPNMEPMHAPMIDLSVKNRFSDLTQEQIGIDLSGSI